MSIKKTALILALAAALLSGCGEPAGLPSESGPAPDTAGARRSDAGEEQLEAMYGAYEAALKIFYHEKILPDGTYIDSKDYGMDGNAFAVFDVDGDGADELLLDYCSTGAADMAAMIYGYDVQTGELHEQFMRFPNLDYYDNGVIIAYFSQNQGLAGRFWPYYLYKYDPVQDIYECAAMADAWDGSVFGTDKNGRPFPGEIDVSGEGIVYYLGGADDKTLGEPVDRSEYEHWLKGYIGGAKELIIPWLPLTPDNIDGGARGTGVLWLKRDRGAQLNFYSEATDKSKAEVESFALEVRRSILARDWEAFAGCAAFPLTVDGEECADSAALIALAPEKLTGGDFVAALVSENCEEMFCNSAEIIMADGRIHMAETAKGSQDGLRVTAINTQ